MKRNNNQNNNTIDDDDDVDDNIKIDCHKFIQSEENDPSQ